MPGKRTTEYWILASLLVASSALILARLGNIYLWGDEAQTACLARTVLKYGYPRGFDGMNYFSLNLGMEYGPNYVWRFHPWFPFYLLAGFFAILGESTFVARLPFALFGIATVILTYYYARSLWGIRRAGILAAALLIICVPFLLLVRQCRYYSPAAFFSLAGLYAYSGMLENRRRSPIYFVLSAVILLNIHYVNCATLILTAVAHSAIFRRDKLKLVILVSAIASAVSLPIIIWFAGMGSILQHGYGGYWPRTLASVLFYLQQIPKHIFHPALLILPAAAYALHRIRRLPREPLGRPTRQNLWLLLSFAAVSLASTALTNQWYFFRYLMPILPVACLIIALMIESGMKIHWAVGVVAIGLLAWWWRMPAYLYEITHDYDGPNEGIVQYLETHASESDLVATNQEDLVLKFYTGMRVIGVTTGEDLSEVKAADWIIIRSNTSARAQEMQRFLDVIRWEEYEADTILYPDLKYENREDPEEHRFRTADVSIPVTIYRRIAD